MLSFFASVAGFILAAYASPLARQGISTISQSTIASYSPYTQFARAAYCPGTATWTCGAACTANSGFVPYVTGGDDSDTPYFFVGYWPSGKAAVVAHEGTDPTQFLSLLVDADFFLEDLDTTLFPGISSSIQAHSGFLGAHSRSAASVLSAVQQVISDHGVSEVITVGHSLGGAIALLDAVYLPLHLPSSIIVRSVLFGLPRVGNPAFASYVDAHLSIVHITNMLDPIPIVPGEFLGFAQPQGEVHILGGTDWVSCPGDDNSSVDCSTGAVPTIFTSDIVDHLGPYNGIWIGTLYC
ncbi:alpha/beta-hydrolase [Dacryopinax primogenitus]|uniref:Alpha/beta-hydrolase n=1 Tax=Dacryopinax primogenitus (strain DJM 731) TaxID=1858805 RepID=M5G0H8_DACPD|nr:alpha/beta-hydrolase [Dacryopinax primogenitus]EJU03751.1 alpha/beta-hydrolase [Dacryopinax primogenitus]